MRRLFQKLLKSTVVSVSSLFLSILLTSILLKALDIEVNTLLQLLGNIIIRLPYYVKKLVKVIKEVLIECKEGKIAWNEFKNVDKRYELENIKLDNEIKEQMIIGRELDEKLKT